MVIHRRGMIKDTIKKNFWEKMDDIFDNVLGFLKVL